MRKKDRHQLLLDLIKEVEITKQEEFVEKLRARNIEVTQATISRDISELGLIKVANNSGGFRYAARQENTGERSETFIRHFARSVVQIKHLDNQLYIQSTPGTAMALKRFLMEGNPPGIFAMITDDDGLLMIFENKDFASNYKEKFEKKGEE